MKINVKIFTFILFIYAFILGILLSIKGYRHERWQSSQIRFLQEQNSSLIDQTAELQNQIVLLMDKVDKLNVKIKYSDTAFNYLAIGNSITLHGQADYWWSENGMAASTVEKDYVHLVANYLKETHGDVCFYAVNFYKWENQAHDRAETYDVINPYLSPKLDLITIQLSENVEDMMTFESDFEALIRYIKHEAPNAEILILDDYWNNDVKEEAKKEAAINTAVPFLSLDEIKGNPEYQCGLEATVYDTDGKPHIVEHNGVAIHPGDKGMSYIADIIIEALKK